MIFGHHLDFKNEPVLKKAYDSFPSDFSQYKNHKTIPIIETSDHTEIYHFHYKTEWTELSGQEARYHAMMPFYQADQISTWALDIKDIVTLIWDAEEKKIIYTKGKNYTPKQLQFWIFHTFFPIVLEIENIYNVLHVGSVEIEEKPVVFSAFSFGGKSTMTDHFIQKGHTMLSDDSLAIDKQGNDYYAIASYPFHRPYRQVETLGYPVTNFATEPKPLHAVYLLEKSEPDTRVQIAEVKGIEKFKAFHYSTFIDYSFMKKRRFDFFTEMAKHVPVYRVTVPWDLERLDEVYNAIVKNSQ